MTLEPHKIAGIFPMLSEEELKGLSEDIKKHGLRDPIFLYEGKILDGRNRAAACRMAGVTPKTRDFVGDFSQAVDFVWSTNFKRRHLNPGQAAACSVAREGIEKDYADTLAAIRAEAADRQRATLKRGTELPKAAPVPTILRERESPPSEASIAAKPNHI